MSTDNYTRARIECAKAEKIANEVHQDISRCLENWKNIKITNGGQTQMRGDYVFTKPPLDLSNWPSREQITRILSDFIQTYNKMVDEWNMLSHEEKTSVQPPLP